KGSVYKLTKIEAPDADNYVTIMYNLSNAPSRISNSSSNYVDIDYDLSGRITTMATITGSNWSYSYDVNGRLDEVTRPDETTESYDYDLQGRLDEVTDSLSETTYYVYDLNDRVTSITDRTGEETTLNYGSTNTTITLPEDNTLVYAFDASGYTNKIFDGLNNYIQITRSETTGNITCVRDREGRRASAPMNTSTLNCVCRQARAELASSGAATQGGAFVPKLGSGGSPLRRMQQSH
ncbi:MAG: RHS repeat protein, partial [Candidatus Coatesbacteria bacterium]|nr:RHS repeat protein [Candidatus Coatesbacteria bacterium]